ncbi:MAG: hypothetical protein M3388_16640 [Acidobacteriota bacterium]|nr:hypothetical protein [Acidobacteriota bacterium]
MPHVISAVRRFVSAKTNRLRRSRFFETERLFSPMLSLLKVAALRVSKVVYRTFTNRGGKRARRKLCGKPKLLKKKSCCASRVSSFKLKSDAPFAKVGVAVKVVG